MPTYIQTIKEQGVFLTSGTVTILSGASLSNSIYLGNRHLTSIITSTAWTAASISFQFSLDNITFYNAYSLTAALTETASSTLTVAIQIAIATTDTFHCARYLKLRSGTSASPVNQAADRVLTVISMID